MVIVGGLFVELVLCGRRGGGCLAVLFTEKVPKVHVAIYLGGALVQ